MGDLGEFYRKQYEETFKYHPKKDEIVEKLVNPGDTPYAQIDVWFTEADSYRMHRLLEAAKKMPVNEDGTVTFQFKAHGS